MPLASGTRIGAYEITAALGSGGMGEVYRARDTKLGREVAIKVLPEIFAADHERLARFEREAKTLATLNHPNIAQVHGFEDIPLISRGGTWGPRGQILVGANGIRQVRQGSESALDTIVPAPPGFEYRFPEFLPDGRHFLFTSGVPFTANPASDAVGIYVGDLDASAPRRIAPDISRAIYRSGRVLFVRDRVLVSQLLNDERLTLVGDPSPMAVDFFTSNIGFGAFAASESGALAYSPGEPDLVQFWWTDRRGQSRETIGGPGPYLFVRPSDQGDRVAFDRYDQQRGTRDVWVMQTRTGEQSRLTFDPADDANPVWSHDGRKVYFISRRTPSGVYEKLVDGPTPETLVAALPGGWPRSVSADGQSLVFQSLSQPWDLLAVRVGAGDRNPVSVVASPANDQDGQLSPTAPLLAFASDESGRSEIYVQGFPESERRWQVSSRGGSQPRWRRDGRELYYVAPDGTLMAVPVGTGDGFRGGQAVPLFQISTVGAGRSSYSPGPDGQRFFLAEPATPRLGIAVVVGAGPSFK